MPDKFATQLDSASSPARETFAITPSDTVAISPVPKGIYVGTGGAVVLRSVDSPADVTYKNLGDGSFIAVRALYVRATGTTATDLVAEA